MIQYFQHLYRANKYRLLLNEYLFTEEPIGFLEFLGWIKSFGPKKVFEDLRTIWDKHNFHDQETL